VRVTSDKQTLILAGEAIPRRDAASSSTNDLGLTDVGPRLTIVATRADDTMLLAQSNFAQKPAAAAGESTSPLMTLALANGQNKLVRSSYPSSTRGTSFSAANEYARTQDLSGNGSRTAIIDTYA
jgi:hypothetical protein